MHLPASKPGTEWGRGGEGGSGGRKKKGKQKKRKFSKSKLPGRNRAYRRLTNRTGYLKNKAFSVFAAVCCNL